MNKILLFLFICGLIFPYSILAQEEPTAEGDIQDAEILIEKNREIKLPREIKVYEFIKWQPKRSEFSLPNKRFENYSYDQPLTPILFSPAKIPVLADRKRYSQYAKVGFGNYGSPLVDVNLVTTGNENTMIGLDFKHLSYAKGHVDGENSASSMTDATAYLKVIWDKVTMKPSLTYRFDKNYFYGYPEGTVVNREDIKRTNHFLDFAVEVQDNNLNDQWTYESDVRLNIFSDNYNNKEKTLGLNSTVGYNEKFYLAANMAWSQYDTDRAVSRNIYRLNPYYHLSLGELVVDLGLSLNFQNDTISSLKSNKVFPYINAKMNLTNDFEVFAKLDAGYDFNTMYFLNSGVSYINPDFTVANSQSDLDLSAGIRGNLSKKASVETRVGYQSVKNMTIFVNNTSDQSLIDVVYDPEVISVFNFGLTAKYDLNPQNNLSFDFVYTAFGTGAIGQVYHRPTTKVKVKGDHEIIKKLSLQWQFAVLSGIKAYDPAADTDVSLDLISKLDMTTHYQITDQWGAFVSFENILNQNYTRYLFYPQRGIVFKLGATFRF